MAVAIVEALEVVHIHQEQHQWDSSVSLLGQGRADLPVEQQPVAHSRERIAGGEQFQITGSPLDPIGDGDVLGLQHHQGIGERIVAGDVTEADPQGTEPVETAHHGGAQKEGVRLFHQQLALELQGKLRELEHDELVAEPRQA